MSVAVFRAVAEAPNPIWMPMPPAAMPINRPASLDSSLWTAIHADAQVKVEAAAAKPKPLVMTPASLQLCTETLGCETGSDDTTPMPMAFLRPTTTSDHEKVGASSLVIAEEQQRQEEESTVESPEEEPLRLSNGVRYHCSRPRRAFPPPLPSMSRRDGPCTRLRPRRLVLQAVPARPHGYLHARRQGGRLRLCFVHYCPATEEDEDHKPQGNGVQDVEEEAEVVDRGTVVELKAPLCRLVINNFVAGTPLVSVDADAEQPPSSRSAGLRRMPSSTNMLAAAVAAASTGTEKDDEEEEEGPERM